MARRTPQNSDNKSGGGWGSFFAFVGGSIAGAAMAYGAVKLSEHLTKEQEEPQRETAREKSLDDPWEAQGTSRPPEVDKPLFDRLLEYRKSYAAVDEGIVADIHMEVEELVTEVEKEIERQLSIPIRSHCIDMLCPVRPALIVDVSLLLELPSGQWNVTQQTNGYSIVKQSPSASSFDAWLAGDVLLPSKLCESIGGVIERSELPDATNCGKLLLQMCVNGQKILVRFNSVICIGENRLTTTLPSSSNCWQSWHVPEELKRFAATAGPAHSWCLEIMQAVAANHPTQMDILSRQILKNAVLHVLDGEDEWQPAALCERFIDLLKALEEYLQAGMLPHFFDPHQNLLENIPAEKRLAASRLLVSNIGDNTLHRLLKTNA